MIYIYFYSTDYVPLYIRLSCRVRSLLVLPLSIFLDWIMKDQVMSWQDFLGVRAILSIFFLLVFSQYWELKMKSKNYASNNRMLSLSHPQLNSDKPIAAKLQYHVKYII